MADEFEDSDLVHAGSFPVAYVPRLFEALQAAEVRFVFEADEQEREQMSAVTASRGGLYGSGSQVHIYVHRDDLPKFEEVYTDVVGEG